MSIVARQEAGEETDHVSRSWSDIEEARRIAGVSDPTWCPPPPPEDLIDPALAVFDWSRSDWPAWFTSADGYEIGSRWRLAQSAHIVVPVHGCPTLALDEDEIGLARLAKLKAETETVRFMVLAQREVPTADRYAVETGTALTLVRTYDPEAEEWVRDLDMVNYTYVEVGATRTYRIEDGLSAGVLIVFSADPRGGRIPFSSRLAHAAIVPEDDFTHRP
jgi:hypothetical protein